MITCTICNSKLRQHLSFMYECKCKKYVCSKHKLNHGCSFDYKKEQQDRIQHHNQTVIKPKLDPI
jgi:hypothetical protein